MSIDLEETLGRELHAVVDDLAIPAMPPVRTESLRAARASRRPRPTMLVAAAAVALIIAGAVALVSLDRGGRDVQPAPSPTETNGTVSLPRTEPTTPYVLDRRLYVDGERLPGTWFWVHGGPKGWIAQRTEGTWAWGRGPEANDFEGLGDQPPMLSPSGEYIAYITDENGQDLLTGFDTDPAGEGLGGVPIELGDPQEGGVVRIRAVTDDGRVVAQGADAALLWLPLVIDGGTVDLAKTAPGKEIVAGTPGGLVVTDGEGGAPYLGELSDEGELTRTADLPRHDDLVVNPAGDRLVWATEGTLGGEVMALDSLETQAVDGSDRGTLTPPDGWRFKVMEWVWEDDDRIVAPVVDDQGSERLVRCAPAAARCVLVTTT